LAGECWIVTRHFRRGCGQTASAQAETLGGTLLNVKQNRGKVN
jgi:hypothetical protein